MNWPQWAGGGDVTSIVMGKKLSLKENWLKSLQDYEITSAWPRDLQLMVEIGGGCKRNAGCTCNWLDDFIDQPRKMSGEGEH